MTREEAKREILFAKREVMADSWIDKAYDVAIKALEQPEIINCRDCKFWQDQEYGVVEVPICARPENKHEKYPFRMMVDGDGFCSYAKR